MPQETLLSRVNDKLDLCRQGNLGVRGVLEILTAVQEHLLQDTETSNGRIDLSLKTLSFSEIEAMRHIGEALGVSECGLLVASKIADSVGITRSVIVNALRKLESAGIIQSRSLGMKGTHIKTILPGWTQRLGLHCKIA